MNIDKFTTGFQKVLTDAESIANKNGNQYMEPLHIMAAILKSTSLPCHED